MAGQWTNIGRERAAWYPVSAPHPGYRAHDLNAQKFSKSGTADWNRLDAELPAPASRQRAITGGRLRKD
jgi:hypothetical protein